ncbi:GDP-mannose-dependent alpha-(1-6)-phosphatidylinositol monomannoside mannosyltransferase [Hartmannibacter diazotrophicus]|uniref:GDP-mannose-dependent alpha-(1-6)-phosphatidylinositol monomannoside mannosyltransferase n=1 Tax=Hartmannibacter diazotrophicus TaxID=1482074 RepID=A0A2C9DAM9_9HYPH|nr:glycosyltransferase family 4 protein [Hartmannibacter diazotrophicus]SON57384.1 GDP-mannose-dependent alpha-(1-6)-phosphatidylinositol monomannoside mannosyltransferase [Hartmannibacter diazotrophicus]
MRKIAVVLKGYPRLSETFIAQELLGLEKAGFDLSIISMRRPTDKKRHPVHDEIRAPVTYLPEYLYQEPLRVLKALWTSKGKPGFGQAFRTFLKDLLRDPTPNRVRRFGQAAVLCAEWPEGADWIHAHFIHTPASVAAYASLISGIPWSCSAHAKDIWTSPDWDLAGKLAASRWTVTCNLSGFDRLKGLTAGRGGVHLSYHGLDLARFAPFDGLRSGGDGSSAERPVTILSVGRAVEKKGYDVLLKALAQLPAELHWRFIHIGGGAKLSDLKRLTLSLGISDRVTFEGALDQQDVLARYRSSDIFALACRVTADGDRDGLPNVLVEASSQGLVCVSTDVSGVPELLSDGENGFIVPPEDPAAFSAALERLIRDPALRLRLGAAAEQRVRADFDHHTSIRQLRALFEDGWKAA